MFSIHKDLALFKKVLINQNKVSEDKNKINNIKQKQKTSLYQHKQNIDTITNLEHPACKFIHNSWTNRKQFSKFAMILYHGLTYSLKNLKGPSQEYLKKKSILLSEPQKQNYSKKQKKFLMLDLDQTLIHSIFDNNKPSDVRIQSEGNQFRFNIRPYCFEFLQKMSEHYVIYVFTASTKDYAEPIVKYLNRKKKTIQGILHRKNCMQTMNGYKIKDLRIIKNRSLEDIVIVDNLVHSFGLQLDNGIPILEFVDNKQDKELMFLQNVLLTAKDCTDVRTFVRERFNIKEMLKYQEKLFLNVHHQKWMTSNKQLKDVSHKELKLINESKLVKVKA